MPKTLSLLALWAVFAAAAVGVGFAAAGLVGDPFTEAGDPTVPLSVPEQVVTEGPATASSGPSPSTSAPSGGTEVRTVRRGLPTRGGYVSARCRGGLVWVAAVPAVGWQLDSRTPGRVREARVRFEPVRDAKGERVEVSATCVGGVPSLQSEHRGAGGHDGSDDSSGGGGS